VSDLVLFKSNPLSKIVANQFAANVVVGFSAYLTVCVLAFEKDSISKKEMLAEPWPATYVTWKWYMGLGPKPEVKIGI
jgi:hypothetical protein